MGQASDPADHRRSRRRFRLTAQTPDQRLELERFRDSVGGTVDLVGLLALERHMIKKTKADRNNALSHLELGFLSLRLGELGGGAHYEDAASEFQWAIDLKPDWPYSWYGMGLAEYGVGDSQVSFVTGIKTMLGKDALTRSAVAFAKSAEVDPAFDRGLVELANTALRQRVNIKLNVALDALRRLGHNSSGPAHPGAARPGAGRARSGRRGLGPGGVPGLPAGGRDQGLGQLEVARTLFLLGRFDGTGPYYEGAANDDSVAVAGYRADLATIAPDSVLREFDQTAGARRAAYLREFWTERDQAGLHAEGERLREHYRRLFYARKNFQLVSLNRHYDIVERYRSGSRDFDDRGSSTSAMASPPAGPPTPRRDSSPTNRGATVGRTAT